MEQQMLKQRAGRSKLKQLADSRGMELQMEHPQLMDDTQLETTSEMRGSGVCGGGEAGMKRVIGSGKRRGSPKKTEMGGTDGVMTGSALLGAPGHGVRKTGGYGRAGKGTRKLEGGFLGALAGLAASLLPSLFGKGKGKDDVAPLLGLAALQSMKGSGNLEGQLKGLVGEGKLEGGFLGSLLSIAGTLLPGIIGAIRGNGSEMKGGYSREGYEAALKHQGRILSYDALPSAIKAQNEALVKQRRAKIMEEDAKKTRVSSEAEYKAWKAEQERKRKEAKEQAEKPFMAEVGDTFKWLIGKGDISEKEMRGGIIGDIIGSIPGFFMDIGNSIDQARWAKEEEERRKKEWENTNPQGAVQKSRRTPAWKKAEMAMTPEQKAAVRAANKSRGLGKMRGCGDNIVAHPSGIQVSHAMMSPAQAGLAGQALGGQDVPPGGVAPVAYGNAPQAPSSFKRNTVGGMVRKAPATAPAAMKGTGARSARGQAIAKLMREKNMTLPEASRYLKQHGSA